MKDEFDYTRDFWNSAKAGKLNVIAFNKGYAGALSRVGLFKSLFNDEGLLVSKGTYGELKKASDKYPNDWTVRACLKFWVLQFKDNAPLDGGTLVDEKNAVKAEVTAFTAKIPDMEKALEAAAEEAIKEFVASDSFKQAQEKLIAGADKYDAEVGEAKAARTITIAEPTAEVKITVLTTRDNEYVCRYAVEAKAVLGNNIADTDILVERDWDRGDVKSIDEVCKLIKTDFQTRTSFDVNRCVEDYLNNLDKDLKQFKLAKAKEEAELRKQKEIEDFKKTVQADVDAGDEPDLSLLEKLARATIAQAQKESDSWAQWRYDDGDSGAAYAMRIYEGSKDLARYLTGLDFSVFINNKEVAHCSATANESDVVDAAGEYIDGLHRSAKIVVYPTGANTDLF